MLAQGVWGAIESVEHVRWLLQNRRVNEGLCAKGAFCKGKMQSDRH